MEREHLGRSRIRVAYVTVAVVVFGLSLVAGDSPFIAMAGAALVVSLLSAFYRHSARTAVG